MNVFKIDKICVQNIFAILEGPINAKRRAYMIV